MSSIEHKKSTKAKGAVSVRELARSAGALLDLIELEGSSFVIGRRGRMIALLCPIPERTIVEITAQPWPGEQEEDALPIVVPESWHTLTEMERTILVHADVFYPRAFPMNGISRDVSAVAVAVSDLELAGLVDLAFAGRTLTSEGHAAARWINAQVDSRAGADS